MITEDLMVKNGEKKQTNGTKVNAKEVHSTPFVDSSCTLTK